MCEFISWKEIRTAYGRSEILFLTHDDIFNTSRGAELRKYTTSDDLTGHGALAWYYYFPANKGVNRECTDFSSPDNFPPEIVSALKAGKMWGIVDYFPKGLLCDPLHDDYKTKCEALFEDYKAKCEALSEDYKTKCEALSNEQWELFTEPKNRAEVWR